MALPTVPPIPQDLFLAVKNGTLTPQEAIKAFEVQATFLRDVEFSETSTPLPTGFPSFDRFEMLKKSQGELVILAARPSMGKSALAFQIALNVAHSGPVLIFSLEMNKESILRRLVASVAQIPAKRIGHPSLSAEVARAKAQISLLPLAVDDRAGLEINTIKSAAIDFSRHYPLQLVVVDYIGLVRARELNNKNQEIGEITGGLKALAKALKCPVLALSQLNRECEKRGKNKQSGNFGDFIPVMSDLRDSGNIEQDADMIFFLSRQEVYDGSRPNIADVRCAKARNGETGDFTMKFIKTQVRFYEEETL